MPTALGFRVVFCSGADDGFSAVSLENASSLSQGWRSRRYCNWPQEIIISFQGIVRLRRIQLLSHEHLIASKVKLAMGSFSPSTNAEHATYTAAEFKPLGHVSFGDNSESNFSARELKNVHVDAVGRFLRLRFERNHVNKLNLFNQVGIVALNVIGDGDPGLERGVAFDVHDTLETKGASAHRDLQRDLNSLDIVASGRIADADLAELVQEYLTSSNGEKLDPATLGVINRPARIEPSEDLAVTMAMDPETAAKIKALTREKERAVAEEQYRLAGQIKQAIEIYRQGGEELLRLSRQKQAAVASEDYEGAQVLKDQIDAIRDRLDVEVFRICASAKEAAPARQTGPALASPRGSEVAAELPQLAEMQRPTTQTLSSVAAASAAAPAKPASPDQAASSKATAVSADDRPLQVAKQPNLDVSITSAPPTRPATTTIGRTPSEPVQPQEHFTPKKSLPRSPPVAVATVSSFDERPVGQSSNGRAAKNSQAPAASAAAASPSSTADLTVAKLTEAQKAAQSAAITVFGENCVAKLNSKAWQLKDEALCDVLRELKAGFPGQDRSRVCAALGQVFQQAASVRVKKVAARVTELVQALVRQYLPQNKLSAPDCETLFAALLPELIQHCGEVAAPARAEAQQLLLDLAQCPAVPSEYSVAKHCLTPLPTGVVWRLAQGVLEVAQGLVETLGLSDAGAPASGISLADVVAFAGPLLRHAKTEVRTAAVTLLTACYQRAGRRVENLLNLDAHKDGALIKMLQDSFSAAKPLSLPPASKAAPKSPAGKSAAVAGDKGGKTKAVSPTPKAKRR